MIRMLFIASALALAACAEAQNQPATLPDNIISDSLWKNRLLIICSPNAPDGNSILERIDRQIDWPQYFDRDLILIDVDADSAVAFIMTRDADRNFQRVSRDYSQERLELSELANCKPETNTLSLIGKDGGLKQKWDDLPAQQEILGLIDSMPMRQQEMKQDTE